jgi:DNA-binding response OmpR family regulator
LALTKELVDLHHGTISVRSEVGRGTTFTVSIPIDRKAYKSEEIATSPLASEKERTQVPLDLSVSEREPAQPESGQLGEKPIVLVVEDNTDVRAYMKVLLVPSYHVLEAEDGAAGIEKAEETVPDLIISDVMMPKMDGYEVCRTLKLNEKTSHIPIILLTAKAASENKIEGLETGADDYLIKPFEPKELMARVKNLIELRRKLRQRFSVSVPLRPGEIAVTSMDDAFLKRLMAVVEERMSDETFSVEELGTLLNMSRVQLHRKITALTNQSASEFIRYMRLHRAMGLLEGDAGTVSEIAYTVGFSDPSHFSRRFHDQFGVAPSEVRKNPGQHNIARKPAQPS